MAKKQCKECKLEVDDLEPIRCGFCDASFHISQQCCGFNHRANRDLFSLGKAMFVSTDCRSVLAGRSIKDYLENTLKASSAAPDSSNNLSSQVQLLAEKVDDLVLTDSTDSQGDGSKTKTLQRGRKRQRVEQIDSSTLTSDRGTRAIDFSDLSISSIVPAAIPAKFWLYLSGFQPLISPDDVQKIVGRCLDLSSPCDVIRLVPKGKDVSNMSFV